MKRTRLQRKTPLKSGGALQRSPMKPSVPAPRTPADGAQAKRKPTRRPAGVPRALREMVIERSGYSCDWCARQLAGELFSVQHRRARGAGGRREGAHTPANLIILCGSATSPGCHSRAENERRDEAYRLGFAIRGEARAPEDVPVFRHLRWWVIPGDGVWVPADPPADFAA